MLEDVIIKVSPVINEIASIITDFEDWESTNKAERAKLLAGKTKLKKKLKLSFNED